MVDDMGAMFARRPGQRDDPPPIAMGSHRDTQPTGGKLASLACSGAEVTLGKLREQTCYISQDDCQCRQLRYCVRAPHPVTYRKLKY
jgi:hypothetical protein